MSEQTFEKADEVTLKVAFTGEHPGVELFTIPSLESKIADLQLELTKYQSYLPKFEELGIKHPDVVATEKKAAEEAKLAEEAKAAEEKAKEEENNK